MSTYFTARSEFSASTITVTNTAELNAAIESLGTTTGGTILLDGNGGPYDIDVEGTYEPLLLRAVSADNPPIVHSIEISDASNVTVTEMIVDSTAVYNVRDEWKKDVTVAGSSNIEIVGNQMRNAAEGVPGQDDDAVVGESLGTIRDSENVTFSHNTVENYFQGLSVLEVDGLTFSDNEVSALQGDGLRLGGVQNVVIADNYMHDFLGTTQNVNHSDMIQFWGTQADSLTQNVVITGNILDSGAGAGTQGIFIRNEDIGKSGAGGGYFRNFTITDNVVHNSSLHGISVSDTAGLTIANNTLLWNEETEILSRPGSDGISTVPAIRTLNTSATTIEGNIAGRIIVGSSLYTGDNQIVTFTDPQADNYAENLFVNLRDLGTSDIADLRLRHDSDLNGRYGAAKSWTSAAEDVEVTINAQTDARDYQTQTFSAAYSLLDGQPIDTATTTFLWEFADGTTASGAEVTRSFDQAGVEAVTLHVTTSDGRSETKTKYFEIQSNDIVTFDFEGGIEDTSDWGAEVETTGTWSGSYVNGTDGQALALNGRSAGEMSRTASQTLNLSSFALSLDLKISDAAKGGTIIGLHKHFQLDVTASGAIDFSLTTDEGAFDVVSAAGLIDDNAWHEISVSYDDAAGELTLYVDGVVVSRSAAHGTTAASTYQGLTVGGDMVKGVRGAVDNVVLTRTPIEGWASAGETQSQSLSAPTSPVEEPEPAAPIVVTTGNDTGTDSSGASVLYSAATGTQVALREGSDYFISRANDFLFARDNFRIELDLTTDTAGATGRFLDIHGTLRAEVDPQGHVRFLLSTDEGTFELRTDLPVFADAGTHNIAIIYSDQAGVLQIEVDGETAAQVDASGTTSALPYWGMQLGSTFGTALDGTASNFVFSQDPDITRVDPEISADFGWAPDHYFSFDGAIHDAIDATTQLRFWSDGAGAYRDGVEGQAFHIDDDSQLGFHRGEIELNDSDGFVIAFDFQRTDLGAGGQLLHLHKVLDTYIDDDGFLHVVLTTDEGTYHVSEDVASFDNSDWHSVEIAFDDAADMLMLEVDGDANILNGASGTTAAQSHWGLTIGSTWGSTVDGNIDNFATADETPPGYFDDLSIA